MHPRGGSSPSNSIRYQPARRLDHDRSRTRYGHRNTRTGRRRVLSCRPAATASTQSMVVRRRGEWIGRAGSVLYLSPSWRPIVARHGVGAGRQNNAPFSVWRLDDPNGTRTRRRCTPWSTTTWYRSTVSHVEYPSSDGTADRLVPRAPQRCRARRPNADDPERLRRVRDHRDADVVADDRGLVRGRGSVRDRRAAGRLRARRGVASAGRRANKQNVFDDFHAAADWLVATGRTSRHDRLAIVGGSNGGLLVGAALTQRPDLVPGGVVCGAAARHGALPAVPHRPAVDRRVRRPRRGRGVRLAARLLAVPPRAWRAPAIRRCCSRPPRATPGSIRCTPARWRPCCSPRPPIRTSARCCCPGGSSRARRGQAGRETADEQADVLAFPRGSDESVGEVRLAAIDIGGDVDAWLAIGLVADDHGSNRQRRNR